MNPPERGSVDEKDAELAAALCSADLSILGGVVRFRRVSLG